MFICSLLDRCNSRKVRNLQLKPKLPPLDPLTQQVRPDCGQDAHKTYLGDAVVGLHIAGEVQQQAAQPGAG